MKFKSTLFLKYIIVFSFGMLFILFQGWLAGVSANLTPAFGIHEWTREHVKISMFISSFFTYLLPLAIATLTIGYLIAKLIKVNKVILFILLSLPTFLITLPSIEFLILRWYLEIPRLTVIAFALWFSLSKFSDKSIS